MKEENQNNEIIIYEGTNGAPCLEVRFGGETAWLSIDQMAELFDKGRTTITEHILNAFNFAYL